ncbi:MAG: hypothetical protein IJI83_05360 [Oscillospiraceae bacterium]|nr:hypothetical protein [Oscillospiraceae bacterium]
MKLIIDIPEEIYKASQIIDVKYEDVIQIPLEVIASGVPLPKGHGRIGDLDKIIKEMQDYHDDCAKTSEYTRLGFETAIAVVEDAQTIIEAESEGKK